MKSTQSGAMSISVVLIALLTLSIGVAAYIRISNKSEDEAAEPPVDIMVKETTPFTFTAAGDFSSSDAAAKTLEGIAKSKSDFTLALGDLGYGGNGTEQVWCDFVKKRIGNDHPFELIAGNHDDGVKDGDISEYVKCLQNKLEGIVGEYGIEYYFDYGNLARFIMISPDIRNYGFDYSEGSSHLQWVIDSIREARSKDINWIILGMHKNCITPGVKPCEIGEDLLNTAVRLKVDLVLQGHEHAYFRSKQLALNPDTCPAIVINDYNENCISEAGDEISRGEGTVLVISGAGGYVLRDVNFEDKEYDYFNTVNGSNSGNSYGFSLFKVTNDSIVGSFNPVTGSFVDNFSIK